MADNEVKVGDQVSYPWGGGRPGGEVAEVKTQGEAAITTKNDNVVKKNAEPNNPAVVIERSGNDVVKKASEIAVDQPGDKHKESATEEKTVTEDDKKENGDAEKKANGDAEPGDKRKAEETSEEKKDEEGADTKKQKTDDVPKENGAEAPKKKGRPAKKDANGEATPKKEPAKKKAPKRAATESGEPRRSGRNAGK